MAETDLATDLARRIRGARHLSGKKVPELARDLGWSVNKLYRLEQGRQIPDVVELAAIAAVTNQEIEFFFGTTSLPQHNGGDGEQVLTRSAPVVNAGDEKAA